MNFYPSFTHAWSHIVKDFKNAALPIHTEKWQGIDISKRPEAKMYELFNYSFSTPIIEESLEHFQKDIKPNLPWADDHFEERVCRQPINPGTQWAKWPWGNSADKFRDSNGQFNHNYMERYWPKWAGKFTDEECYPLGKGSAENKGPFEQPHKGIRYNYGDLDDVVNQLRNEPLTRQAYMPVFFPEDTGAVHGSRVPCSLGYHFIQRNGFLHINYYLRSCEVYRHYRDDCYLTIRLLLWVLNELRKKDESWKNIKPGIYSMFITSFHCFVNDRINLE